MFRSPASLITGTSRPALGVDGDAEVLLAVVDDLVAVDAGVDHRVDLERLDDGLGEERQERQLDALAAWKSRLARSRSRAILVTSTSTTVVSWAETCSDSTIRAIDLAQPGHLLGRAALRGPDGFGRPAPAPRAALGAAAAGGLRLGRGLAARRPSGGLGGVEDVLLADPAADAGAVDRGQVDAVLGGQLADQRGDVVAASPSAADWPADWPPDWRPRACAVGCSAEASRRASAARPAPPAGRLLRLRLEAFSASGCAGCGAPPAGGRLRLLGAFSGSAAAAPRRPAARPAGCAPAAGAGRRPPPEPSPMTPGRRRPGRSRPRRPGSSAGCRRPATGPRCRPCRWRPRAAARRPRRRRPRPSASG